MHGKPHNQPRPSVIQQPTTTKRLATQSDHDSGTGPRAQPDFADNVEERSWMFAAGLPQLWNTGSCRYVAIGPNKDSKR